MIYKRGEAYYKSGRVMDLQYDREELTCRAVVTGSEEYRVQVRLSNEGHVKDADCDCPAFGAYYTYCKHIAAVLMALHEKLTKGTGTLDGSRNISSHSLQQQRGPSSKSMEKTNRIVSMLEQMYLQSEQHSSDGEGVNDRDQLQTEWMIKVIPVDYRKHMLALEMKVGIQRLYIVQKIREFLKSVDRQESFTFTKHFVYDPLDQRFVDEDEQVITALQEIIRNEDALKATLGPHSFGSTRTVSERQLIIPPYAWKPLISLLTERGASLYVEEEVFQSVRISEEKLPLQFHLNSASKEGYQLELGELGKVMILDSYQSVFHNGVFYPCNRAQLRLIQEMKDQLEFALQPKLLIAEEQIEDFIFRAVPGLKTVGHVQLSPELYEKVVQPHLMIKFFMDWHDDRLWAKLEYHYDDTVIHPLLDQMEKPEGKHLIVVRDLEKENEMMRLIESALFKFNGKHLFIEDENAIAHFLFEILPKIEEKAEVYTTSSMKNVIYHRDFTPRVHLEVDEKTRLLDITFDMEGIEESEIQHVLDHMLEKKKYHRLKNGAFLSLQSTPFETIGHLLKNLGWSKQSTNSDHLQLPMIRSLQLDEEIHDNSHIRVGKQLVQMLTRIRRPEQLSFEPPAALASILRDYQKVGFSWFKTLAHYRFGGILADDMGLGKTLQTIAFLLSQQEQQLSEATRPALIVAPSSLTYNWESEFERFAPQMRVKVITGDRKERLEQMESIGEAEVLITSYPLLRRDVKWYAAQSFSTFILDEAQVIKNHASITAQAVKMITAVHKFALTGTPIENRLEELWSILDAVLPELFPDRKRFSELSREQIARMVRPFILRRMKKDVLKELPDKIETVQYSELHLEQKKLYAAYLQRIQQETKTHLAQEGLQKSRMKILAGLTRLRQLCCHPSLFIENYEGESGKLEQLLDMVETGISSGKRMLVFSQFTGMLYLIRKELEKRKIDYFYLDGGTPSGDRVKMAHRFNKGERELFLISLKAGGTGLNLTGADTVILFDLWWNPAVEQQAADRAHRMGQKNVVQVIRLITQGTIEEKMYELQQKKKDLIEQVINSGEGDLSSLTEEEICEILSISYA